MEKMEYLLVQLVIVVVVCFAISTAFIGFCLGTINNKLDRIEHKGE